MPRINLGFNPDFAPFAALEDGAPKGIAIERATLAFDAAGIAASFKPVALPDMEKELGAGRLDALAGVAVTPDRADRLHYSRPLALTGGAWFVRVGSLWPSDEVLRQPTGDRLRVISPAAGPLAAYIRRRYPALILETCTDYGDALAAVIDGSADAAALNWQVGWLQAERDNPGHFILAPAPFVEIPLALAVPTGDPAGLIGRLDPHIPEDWGSVAAARPG